MTRTAAGTFVGIAAALCLATATPVAAHEIQPMIATVAPSGSTANYRLMIRNSDAMPVTLEINPTRVTVDDDGAVTRTPETADVILFPPQVIVQPGTEQAIQVRYVGDPAITQGRIYGIVVSQLPVDFKQITNSDSSQTQVKIGFDFISHMLVEPQGSKPALTISAVSREADGDLKFDVVNSGNGVALLRNAEWKMSSGATSVVVPADKVQFGAFGAILPGGRRTITIAAANAPGLTGDVTAAVTLK